jgi:hypothetical protein
MFLNELISNLGMGKPFMQTTVRSASSGFAWAKRRLAVVVRQNSDQSRTLGSALRASRQFTEHHYLWSDAYN